MSLLLLALAATATEPTLLNAQGLDPDLAVVVLIDAAGADRAALTAAGVSLIDPTYLVRNGSLDFVDPTPTRPTLTAADVSEEWLPTTKLDDRELCGMSGVPITFEGTTLVGLADVDIAMIVDPVGANPTPYPYPVPIDWDADALDGLEPSPFLLDGRSQIVVEGWAVVLNSSDEIVGGWPTPIPRR